MSTGQDGEAVYSGCGRHWYSGVIGPLLTESFVSGMQVLSIPPECEIPQHFQISFANGQVSNVVLPSYNIGCYKRQGQSVSGLNYGLVCQIKSSFFTMSCASVLHVSCSSE